MSNVEMQGENDDTKLSQLLDALKKFHETKNELEAFLNGKLEPTFLQKYGSITEKMEEMKSLLMIFKAFDPPEQEAFVSRNDCEQTKNDPLTGESEKERVSNLLHDYSTLENTVSEIKKHFTELEEEGISCKSSENFVDLYEKHIQSSNFIAQDTFSNVIARLHNLQATESKDANLFQRHQLEESENEKGLDRNLTELVTDLDQFETDDFKLLSNVEVCLCDKTCQKRVYEIVLPVDGKVISEELWVIFTPRDTFDKTMTVQDIIIKNNELPISDLKERGYSEATLPRLFAELKSRLYLQKS